MKNLLYFAAATLVLGSATAAPLKSAVVTTAVNDVKLSEKSSEARPIGTGQKLSGSSTLLTGRNSRAAMTFPDKTVTRVGANSVFRFSSGSRDMEISQGSFLLQCPKNAGGATIRTATVTAAITGTTTMMEYSPGKSVKFICLEGTAKLRNKSGDKVEIPAGKMMIVDPNAENFPPAVNVNIAKMVRTAALTNSKEFGGLGAEAEAAINETIAQQKEEIENGDLQPAGLVRRGPGSKDPENPNRSLLSEIFYRSDYNPNPNPFPSTGF